MPDSQHDQPFEAFFHKAVNQQPFGFQFRFAQNLHPLVSVPTGLGKTAMAVVGWLWRRFGAGEQIRKQTPRRLVYCLPMRVLVEQTRDNSDAWLKNLRAASFVKRDIPVHVLMGGEDEDDWDIHPEREAIIIGTQDMLLSRALNRGYAASRSRWPLQFGLLHTDCLWVFDEIQLMGSGLATTAQLEAFRRLLPDANAELAKNAHGCRSVWMSATMQADWLKTVDFRNWLDVLARLELDAEDHKNDEVGRRWTASKRLEMAQATMGDPNALASEIRQAHKPGTRTIVVVNTVKRAGELFDVLRSGTDDAPVSGTKGSRRKSLPAAGGFEAITSAKPSVILLHSRFRPGDRAQAVASALAPIDADGPGAIIVSTQVIEAGVDVSATTLFTELAPWASLVQRFGRCNRRGRDNNNNNHAAVHWIPLPAKEADVAKVTAPYELDDLRAAAEQLTKLTDVGLKSLPKVTLPFEHTHVIRRRDLIDLFDTTPDLAGNDIDIDRFVRDVEDSDVWVFWRAWDRPRGHEPPSSAEQAPRREELCSAPIGEFREFTKKHGGQIRRWTFLDATWERVDAAKVMPGQVFLVHADAGGYSAETGWTPANRAHVEPVVLPGVTSDTPDATDADKLSRIGVWQTIAQHTDEVCSEIESILAVLEPAEAKELRTAARWHDWGKGHEVFQAALPDGVPDATIAWGKAKGMWKRYGRRHFRHELASALAVLADSDGVIPNGQRDLLAYLIAAHHGKVRLSIRSLPNEHRPRDRDGNPQPHKRFARGVWDGDTLPRTDLGGGVTAPVVALSLEPMELGLCEQPPFEGQPSWTERMIRLRDLLGPFRLAYLEAILRAADMRASKAAEQCAVSDHHPRTKRLHQGN